MPGEMTEDRLVQKTVADYFRDALGWQAVYAFNDEIFGDGSTLGRFSDREVVLVRYLRQALESLNPGLPPIAYETAIKQITESSVAKSTLQTNCEKYAFIKDGVAVSYRNHEGKIEHKKLRLINFEEPEANHFLVVRELWVKGSPYRRRPDIIGFVNGLPLLFIELKNIHKDIRRAYDDNLSDYKDTIPHIFHHNALLVLSNGDEAKIGSLSSKYEHFHEWKRLAEEDAGAIDLQTLLKGVCTKRNFLDIVENFILFDDSTGKLIKIIARNHQFLGVNRAVEAVNNRQQRNGQLGVFWHTQGSGKSYSMVFFAEKARRKLNGNFTFLVVTDREDLDTQIYKTFAGCGIVDNDRDDCRASSGDNLEKIVKIDKPYVFTMIHKFNKRIDPDQPYTNRDDIIVISDEAHRTQYGQLAENMRYALPKAHYIGFTGTPLFQNDEITRRIFGDYVSTYDFQRAVDDNATVPLYYDNRGEKLKITTSELNERVAAKLEEVEVDRNQEARLERELGQDYQIITAEKRLDAIANDFVRHYTTRWETGKAMLVCIDKITTGRMYNLMQKYWQERIREAEAEVGRASDEQEMAQLLRQLEWLKQTEIAVVISEEQNEVKKFQTWQLDIVPHREKIKNGYETPDGKRLDVDAAFKDSEHPFRIAIVCAMWLTGFDVPSLSTLYLDKPLRAHTLMQTIARANRVYEGKNNGLIVDYCGILKNLRQALATFAMPAPNDGEESTVVPVKPEEELIEGLKEAIELLHGFLAERGFKLESIIEQTGFERIAAIKAAKEVINQSEETRKRFQILAREVFKKYRACLTIRAAYRYRKMYDAIDIIYKKLQDDIAQADISHILRQLHQMVDEAITPNSEVAAEDQDKIYDISRIDFEKLKQEFHKSTQKNTTVQCLKNEVEKRLQRMIRQNPGRLNLYQRYQEIIEEYNKEKDRVTIEQTFEALLQFVETMDEEDKRAVRENLDEDTLALFDLLLKPELSTKDRNWLKNVAKELLERLKTEYLNVTVWRENESTIAGVKTFIYDFLWDDKTGLPEEFYSEEEINRKTEIIFTHIFTQYNPTDMQPQF